MSKEPRHHLKHPAVPPEARHEAPPPDTPQQEIQPPQATRNPWYLVLLLAILIAPFAAILTVPGNRVLGNDQCDNPSGYYFYAHYMGQCWRQGIVPLWNPYIMLGLPFLGDGEASVFHPLSFLFTLLRTQLAINWLIAISFTLTGLFFYGYLRALRLGRPAAWCGAVTWSFSSAMISRIYAGHLNILLTFISIPLILMLWERYRAAGGVRRLAGIALAYGLMVLAYYPQFLYIFSLFFLFYVLIQSAAAIQDHSSTLRTEAKAIGLLGLAILLGVGLGAIQLFPSLDFVSRSHRQSASLDYCGRFSFPPENLLTLIAPRFFGTTIKEGPAVYWGRNYFWEMWLYLGVLPLMLAVAGAWAAPRRRRIVLLACAALFLLLGLGKNTPLFPLIYDYVPLFDVFRGSSKNTLIALFCLVTLSAYGFEALFNETNPARRHRLCRIALGAGAGMFLIAALAMILLVLGAEADGSNWQRFVGWTLNSGERYKPPVGTPTPEVLRASADGAARALGRAMILIALSAGLLPILNPPRLRKALFPAAAILVLADLLGVFHSLTRTFDRSLTQLPLDLDESIASFVYPPRILNPNPMPNIAMKSGYSSPFGYTGNTLKRYNEFISLVQGQDPAQSRAASGFEKITPYYKMLAFDAMAVDRTKVPRGARRIGRLGKRVLVPYEDVSEKLPRAFLAAAPRYFSLRADALGYVFSQGVDVQASPAIERADGGVAAHPLEQGETVRFIAYRPGRVVLETQSNHPRELILCGMFERNWTARVNGQPKAVEPANYIFRAVRVPAGTSRVVFEYRPAAFYRGAAVSAVALGLLLLLLIRGDAPLQKKIALPRPLPVAALARPRRGHAPPLSQRIFPLHHPICPVFRIFVMDMRERIINYRGNEATQS